MSSCPACGSESTRWAHQLALVVHAECRHCGMQYHYDAEEDEDCDDDGRFATDAEADEDCIAPDGQSDETQDWDDTGLW